MSSTLTRMVMGRSLRLTVKSATANNAKRRDRAKVNGGTRHTCHLIIGDWQPPGAKLPASRRARTKTLNLRNGRAMQRVRIEQEPSAIPDRCRSMGAHDLGAATMIETDTLLVKCPHCGGWPMAACFPKPNSPQREIRFRCAQCRHQEGGRLPRAGSGERLSGNPAHSAAHREMR
jgi:hypothetical protein